MMTTNLTKNWFTGFHFDFVGMKKITYVISSIVVVVSLVSIFFVNGLEFNNYNTSDPWRLCCFSIVDMYFATKKTS